MEVSSSSIGIFYVRRALGLAPYAIKRNKKGRIEIQRSILITLYSCGIIVALTSLTYNGLLFDAKSKLPIRPSFRMKSATSKVVTAIDVSVVVFASIAGLMCSIVGLHQTQELNRRLQEADDALVIYTDQAKDRKRSYALMLAVMGVMSTMLGLDIYSWCQYANKIAQANQASPKLNVQWYIPFYGLYYVLMGLHVHFALSAVGIGRRYRRLNLALRNSFLEDVKSNKGRGDGGDGVAGNQVPTINAINGKTVDILSSTTLMPSMITMMANQKKMLSSQKIINGGGGGGRKTAGHILPKQHTLDRLAYTHESLGKAMNNVSGAFGFAVLFMLTSCLLHLVATSYFLFLDVLDIDKSRESWLQALWLLFHIIRLLLIVEPCHITCVEAKKTIVLLCEIQRHCKDELMTSPMERFWQQLIADNAKFSACGMCTIDRQILTSFSGAIATYLVILIQFQKTDG